MPSKNGIIVDTVLLFINMSECSGISNEILTTCHVVCVFNINFYILFVFLCQQMLCNPIGTKPSLLGCITFQIGGGNPILYKVLHYWLYEPVDVPYTCMCMWVVRTEWQ